MKFDEWWYNKGSGIVPKEGEETEQFAMRISRESWKACKPSKKGDGDLINALKYMKDDHPCCAGTFGVLIERLEND